MILKNYVIVVVVGCDINNRSTVILPVLCAGACQVLAKFTMHLCHIGILLTRVKPVLTPGVQLGNQIMACKLLEDRTD